MSTSRSPINTQYVLHGQVLETVSSACYLGVDISSGPPRWRRGSGLDFGSEDPGSIPRLPSPRVNPLMARR